MIVYGIPTCDTVRKAIKALAAAGHAPQLRDVRTQPLSAAEIAELVAAFGPEVINRRSTGWRALSAAERAQEPAALLAAHPVLMKRPVIRGAGGLTLGWSAAVAAQHGA